jgi:hypothetical protein
MVDFDRPQRVLSPDSEFVEKPVRAGAAPGANPGYPHCDQLATMKMRVRDDVQQALPPSRC